MHAGLCVSKNFLLCSLLYPLSRSWFVLPANRTRSRSSRSSHSDFPKGFSFGVCQSIPPEIVEQFLLYPAPSREARLAGDGINSYCCIVRCRQLICQKHPGSLVPFHACRAERNTCQRTTNPNYPDLRTHTELIHQG